MGGTQVNYVNQRGSRANLVAGDVLDVMTINRTYTDLENLGAPFYNGLMEPDVRREIEHGAAAPEKGPMSADHYVSIVSPLVENDLRQNSTIVTAWSYSDVSRSISTRSAIGRASTLPSRTCCRGGWAPLRSMAEHRLRRFSGVGHRYTIIVTATDR